MDMDKNVRTAIIIAIISIIVSLGGIVFASLTATLTISGSTQLVPVGWSIQFTNVTAAESGDATGTLPTLAATSMSNYAVTLRNPGDKVVYTITLKNLGEIDAILSSYQNGTLGGPTCEGTGGNDEDDAELVCDNLVYTLTYDNLSTPNAGVDLLPAAPAVGSTQTLLLTIEYPSSLTEEDMPEDTVVITMPTVSFIYDQAP